MSSVAQGTVIEAGAVDELQASFRGELVRPGAAGYDEHRKVWNGSIDRSPGLIARCTGVADVRAAVRIARERDLLVAVRGGGHSFPGLSVCDDGMLIDLGPMKGIRVDPGAGTVRAQAGVLLGELDRETQEFGLAVPSGIVTHTGLAGLTLGGGIGWVMRKYGLTIDQLRSVDVITADGEFVKASEDENADLFWGVRGGGGNFGIVTDFEFQLNPLGPYVVAGPVFWSMEDAPEVLRFYRDWIADCPDELMTIAVQRRAPALPIVPPDLVGELVMAVVVCYSGPVEDGERVVRPLRSSGHPCSIFAGQSPIWPISRRSIRRSRTAGRTTSDPVTSQNSMTTSSTSSSSTVNASFRRLAASPCGRWAEQLHVSTKARPHSMGAMPGSPSTSTATVRPPMASTPAPMGSRLLVRPRTPPHQRLRELPHGRGRGAGQAGLRCR